MNAITEIENSQKKTKLPEVHVGDTVKIHQRISEGKKSRIQVFEGLVIRYRKTGSVQAFITVRKIASGIGVEKSWFVHSPSIEKIEVMKRSKVRRAFLSYMRDRSGKSARLVEMGFDKEAVNASDHRTSAQKAEEEQAEIKKDIDASADTAAKDDVMNQPDTENTDDEVKKEQKDAAKDDATPASDNVPEDAPADEKVNSDGNDEQQEAAEEFQQGVDKAEKK
ncbi:50S ribosomal protein L19 [Candidatus Saccharibacteria bacterium]|nr:50S ribosomal protein L19 [Candidatus Saccharibacteria bacterium]